MLYTRNDEMSSRYRYHQVWVTENVPVGTVVLRLKARDRDTGQNAAIVYEFSKHTAEEYGHLFGIKSETGKIYVKNSLDFEVCCWILANDK